jgi:hypothetical protein
MGSGCSSYWQLRDGEIETLNESVENIAPVAVCRERQAEQRRAEDRALGQVRAQEQEW